MTEGHQERSCKNCGNGVGDDKCLYLDFCDDLSGWRPKEKEMEKIQMTEEQAREMVYKCLDSYDSIRDYMIIEMKNHGYIRKSELETLVDEAEQKYEDLLLRFSLNSFVIAELKILNDGFQALKKDHPEFKSN